MILKEITPWNDKYYPKYSAFFLKIFLCRNNMKTCKNTKY